MIRRSIFGGATLFAVAMTLAMNGFAAGKVQDGQQGPPPGQRGPGGPGGFGQPGGRQGRPPMAMRPMTLLSAPIRELAAALKLSDEQRGKLQKIHEDFRDELESVRPQPPAPGEEPAPPADRGDKIKGIEEKAEKAMMAVLSDDQRKQVPDLLRSWNIMRQIGLPLDTADRLKLTADQMSVLEKAIKERRPPMGRGPGMGGPGGRGQMAGRPGFPGGGPGGFNGQGGPGGPDGGPGGPGGFDGPGQGGPGPGGPGELPPPPPGGDNGGPGDQP